MTSMVWYAALVGAVALERICELVVSKRHLAWAEENGGIESGRSHYPAMVVLHVALLAGCLAEVVAYDRQFVPLVGWPMFVVVILSQALRWWCVATLGRQWNTRVVVVPGLPLVRSGPYRWFRHPNYVAVVAEGIALPLVHQAWVTALVFTAANALVLTIRIRCEERALSVAGTAS